MRAPVRDHLGVGLLGNVQNKRAAVDIAQIGAVWVAGIDVGVVQAERIAAAEKALKEFEGSLPEKIAAWSKASSDDSAWQVITPIAFNATSGSRLELENDSSIYASGKSARGKYHIFGTTEMKNITGIVGILPHPTPY